MAARNDFATPQLSAVNGATGVVFTIDDEVVGVMGFTVANDMITEIDFVLNPEKLSRVGRAE